MKFKIQKSKNGQYFFCLFSRNGEVIATSEMYISKQSCIKGIKAVRRAAFFACIKDTTV